MRLIWLLLMMTAMASAACGTASPAPTAETNAAANSEDTTSAETAPTEGQAESASAETSAYNGPAWAQTELINARTGESFRLADFAGKAVFVEPFATWCTNCRNQMNRINSIIGQPNTENYVFVALSVESGITADDLADYAERNGFNFIFAALPDTMIADLVAQFGRSITNPPSTPHFIIYPDGSVSELTTGPESAEDVLAQLAGG